MSLDGNKIIVCDKKTIKIFDEVKEKYIKEYPTDTPLSAFFSPDRKKIISCHLHSIISRNTNLALSGIRLWDTNNQTSYISEKYGSFFYAAFSPDGNKIAGSSQLGYLTIFDITQINNEYEKS